MTAEKTALSWSIPRLGTSPHTRIERRIDIREDFAPAAKSNRPTTTVATNVIPRGHASSPPDKIFANIADRFFWPGPQSRHVRCFRRTDMPTCRSQRLIMMAEEGSFQSPYTFSSNKSLKNHLHHRQRGERATRLQTGEKCAGIEKETRERRRESATCASCARSMSAFSLHFI